MLLEGVFKSKFGCFFSFVSHCLSMAQCHIYIKNIVYEQISNLLNTLYI